MKIQRIRGTRDIFAKEADKYIFVENLIRKIFKKYAYQEIRTPVFEDTSLFLRSIGEVTDIVEKEMYSFNDKKGRNLTLRPEGTAGVIRAYIENNIGSEGKISRLYYIGKMYRYERPQEGRYREFFQAGIELIGDSSVFADIEVIFIAKEVLEVLGLNKLKLKINMIGCDLCKENLRKSILSFFNDKKNELCLDCINRLDKNPLRILDCKNNKCNILINNYIADSKDSRYCGNCKEKFNKALDYLTDIKMIYEIDNRLVRGLDYYTGLVFEIVDDNNLALAAGGRYDNLISELGGHPTAATGFAFGLDRVVERINIEIIGKEKKILIALQNENWIKEIFSIIKQLNPENKSYELYYSNKNISKIFSYANKNDFDFIIILGDDEWKKNKISIKNLKTKIQSELEINDLIRYNYD